MKPGPRTLKVVINLLTGVGAGLSVVSIPFALNGGIRVAWTLMGLALVIDWVDGSLVRFFELDPRLTSYDGVRLDEYADLMTYVIAPLMVALASGQLPMNLPGYSVVVFVSVVSVLQFAREDTKTTRAFWGWPCYWNFVYFYGWGLELAFPTMGTLSLFFGLATLAPVPYPYPSMFPVQKIVLTVFGVFWGVLVAIFVAVPELPKFYLLLSLVFPLYYLLLPVFYYEELQ